MILENEGLFRSNSQTSKVSDVLEITDKKMTGFRAVLQTHEGLPVVLRATYPENKVALTESK